MNRNILRTLRRKPRKPYSCPACGKTTDDYGNPLRPGQMAADLADYISNGGVLVQGEGFCRGCGGMLW